MNIEINPELKAQIEAEMKAEQQEKHLVDKVTESADAIRENLKSVKGENYARLVEIGVLVNKRSQLMNAVLTIAKEHGAPDLIRSLLAGADASLSAHVLNHAALIINKDADGEYANELTDWIDRIVEAEQAGIDAVKDQLFGGKNED